MPRGAVQLAFHEEGEYARCSIHRTAVAAASARGAATDRRVCPASSRLLGAEEPGGEAQVLAAAQIVGEPTARLLRRAEALAVFSKDGLAAEGRGNGRGGVTAFVVQVQLRGEDVLRERRAVCQFPQDPQSPRPLPSSARALWGTPAVACPCFLAAGEAQVVHELTVGAVRLHVAGDVPISRGIALAVIVIAVVARVVKGRATGASLPGAAQVVRNNAATRGVVQQHVLQLTLVLHETVHAPPVHVDGAQVSHEVRAESR